MAKQVNPKPKGKGANQQVITESEKRSRNSSPLTWKPTIDRTTTPPKGEPDKKK